MSASLKFNISLDTIHRWWVNRTDIFPKRKRVSQSYKLDRDHLIRLIEANPDMMLKELSSELNVSIHMDETGFSPRTSRTHGYGIVGKRIYGNVDSAKRPRISLIGGYLNNKLIAPILFDGNCNTLMINLWLKDHILPTLKKDRGNRHG